MTFIFGGVYQGMEEAARSRGATEIRCLTADSTEIDFSSGAVSGLEQFALGCVRRGQSPAEYMAAHRAEWEDCILIGVDLSAGVVPMKAELRTWRDENGRMNNYLASQADHVIRMFCGIAQVIK